MNKVLIVEDDPTIARIYQGLLRLEGYEGEVAKDGEAAIESLTRFRPDLVLLDLMLPKKNGIQVLKHIRANPALNELPVIVFTNAYMGSLMREALQAGATHCVAKAKCSPKHVMQTIRGYLAVACSAGVEPLPQRTPARAAEATPPAPNVPAVAACEAETDAPSILNQAAQLLGEMRSKLLALAKTEPNGGQLSHLLTLRQALTVLTTGAADAGFHAVAQMGRVLEDLVRVLSANPTKLDPPTLRAIAQSLDCLDALVRRAARGEDSTLKASMVLVLDDDEVSRAMISSTVERLGLRCIAMDDQSRASKLLQGNPYDLIFLDADTPHLEGPQLCRKLREPGHNQSTPVVFTTGRTNLESRALSVMSGADDFIRKPLSQAELAVKVLLHVFNPRARAVPQPAASSPMLLDPGKPPPGRTQRGAAVCAASAT